MDFVFFSFHSIVVYEGGAVVNQARSLWRLELVRTKWAGGYINWGHPLRIQHTTTGRYLAYAENYEVNLVKSEDATVSATAFCLAQNKVCFLSHFPGLNLCCFQCTAILASLLSLIYWLLARAPLKDMLFLG